MSLVVLAALACAPANQQSDSTPSAAAPSAETPCTPLESRQANAPDQRPTFPGQTRACGVTSNFPLEVTVVARGLSKPWAVEPLPDGSLLITEKPGRMRLISRDGKLGEPITGVPKVDDRGQGGLLDVALSPTFDRDRVIFFSYTEPREGGNGTTVGRADLSEDGRSLTNVRVVFRAMPTYNGTMHYGSRLAFGPDGFLYVTLGERSDIAIRPQAQQMDSHMGKTIRIDRNGAVPGDNPFAGTGALPGIYTIGHRNIQSAVFDSRGRLWIIEHGPKGGDEVNLLQPGKNYGWPIQSFGEEYSGQPIATAQTTRPGIVDPVYYWDPVIAPSGAEFYSGDMFPEWRGNLFVGALADQRLVRLVIENDRVVGEEHLLTDRGRRIRDVRQGRDGALYVTTDEANGEVLRISRRR
ncbi:MAG TPA: PQQ-dependent sugar dehydrogenase [Thermoanaerobaculia bacterium]